MPATPKAAPRLGERLGDAVGLLLQRGTRNHLYARLVEGVDGVSPTTYPVISGVARIGPVTATHLAGEIGLDRTVASRHATELESAGLLRREPDPDDPRRSLLLLTATGQRTVAAMRRRLSAIFAEQLAGWPAEQSAAFVAGFERFVAEQRRQTT